MLKTCLAWMPFSDMVQCTSRAALLRCGPTSHRKPLSALHERYPVARILGCLHVLDPLQKPDLVRALRHRLLLSDLLWDSLLLVHGSLRHGQATSNQGRRRSTQCHPMLPVGRCLPGRQVLNQQVNGCRVLLLQGGCACPLLLHGACALFDGDT